MNNNYIAKIEINDTLNCEEYVKELPMVKHLITDGSLEFNSNVTFIVGENGSGKSTLIEAIAVAYGFNPEGGSKNFNFSTSKAHSNLYDDLRIIKKNNAKDGYFLRAESFFNVATNLEKLDEGNQGSKLVHSYGGVYLHDQSHGESFISLISNRFGGNGIYILDEPEAALSPNKLLFLLSEIDRLVKNNSQFIIATHSPILLTYPNSDIYELSNKGFNLVKYEDTEHFNLTKNYLNNPEMYLNHLLDK